MNGFAGSGSGYMMIANTVGVDSGHGVTKDISAQFVKEKTKYEKNN